MMAAPRTLYEKIWDDHVIRSRDDGIDLIWIDRHLVHEVSSPQAFESLRMAGRNVRRGDLTLAIADHNVPTENRHLPIADVHSAKQVALLEQNAAEFGIGHLGMTHPDQGIVHVVGPERGFTLPGLTLVCGDSHTATHGALGALAFGIGTSEIEHVLATQSLWLRRSKTLRVELTGTLAPGVSAKDIALALIGLIGANGGTGHVIEFVGPAVARLSVEARMTLCNMAIEAGARSGLIAPDDVTIAYVASRPEAPTGESWHKAVAYWRSLASDPGCHYDRSVAIDVGSLAPIVSWGVSPEQVIPIDGCIPDVDNLDDPSDAEAARRALDYMALRPDAPIEGLPIENVFIGSCTNSRIEDLRAAAQIAEGRKVAANVRQALVVPGSAAVRRQAEAEGLDRIFIEAGFSWREPGCSMCVGLNPDKVPPGERCASTSNRNFIGRQGPGARTHLLSPAMAAAAAVTGRLVDVRRMVN
nr:3-isopropylmalate dehydratase large subunit [Sphingomonas sp. Y57]